MVCAVWLVMAFALRLALSDAHGIDGDDGFSLHLTRYAVDELIIGLQTQSLDIHPPLYYLVLKGWMALGGESLLALRWLNIAMNLLLGALLLRLAAQVFGWHSAVFVGLLWAFAPLALFTNQQLRMYTLLALATGLALFIMLQLPQRRRRWRWYAALAVTTTALLYTHVLGVVVAGAVGVLALVQWRVGLVRGRDVVWTLGALLLAACAYLPFAVSGFGRYLGGGAFSAQNPQAIAPPLQVPGQILLTTLTHHGVDSPIVGGLVALGFALGLAALWRTGRRRVTPLLAFVGVLYLGLMAMLLLTSFYRPRYLALFLPPVLLVCGGMIATLPHRIGQGIVTGALLAGMLLGVRAYLHPATADDFREAAFFLERRALPDDLILIVPAWGARAFDYHYAGEAEVVAALSGVADDLDLDHHFAPLIAGYERVWLVRFQPEVSDAANRLPQWFDAQADTITQVFPSGMQIIGYDTTRTEATLPAHARPLDAAFGDGLHLRGVHLPVQEARTTDSRLHPPSTWIPVTLYWATTAPLDDVHIRARLTDGLGQTWGLPLERPNDTQGRHPPGTWQTNTLYELYFDVNLNPAISAGTYLLEVMVFDGDTPLPAAGADAIPEQARVLLGEVRLR